MRFLCLYITKICLLLTQSIVALFCALLILLSDVCLGFMVEKDWFALYSLCQSFSLSVWNITIMPVAIIPVLWNIYLFFFFFHVYM